LGPEAVDAISSAYGTAMDKIAAKLAADGPKLKSAVIATLDEQHKMAKKFVQHGGKI
jgi:hexokinase